MVHAGDLLVQIDPRPFQAKLDQDTATLAKDTALFSNAALDLKRFRGLAVSNAISAEMLDTQASTVAQDQATLMADRAQIEQDKLQLAYTTIKAPIDGVAGFREVDVGNLVAPTDTKPLLTVVQMQPVAVLFQLPQGTIPEIQAGQAAARGAWRAHRRGMDAERRPQTGQRHAGDDQQHGQRRERHDHAQGHLQQSAQQAVAGRVRPGPPHHETERPWADRSGGGGCSRARPAPSSGS